MSTIGFIYLVHLYTFRNHRECIYEFLGFFNFEHVNADWEAIC